MFNEFTGTGKAHSMTFYLWNEYIIDVEIAFEYIYVEKALNWNMHISAFTEMLCCYAFAYDHQNYSCWGIQCGDVLATRNRTRGEHKASRGRACSETLRKYIF